MALVETFEGAVPVPFGAGSDDVYADMLAALLSEDVDAVVDDDVVFVPLGATHPDYELAFTVQTGNRWGIAVAKDRPDTLAEIDGALVRLIESGRLRKVWEEWLPTLDYPFAVGPDDPAAGGRGWPAGRTRRRSCDSRRPLRPRRSAKRCGRPAANRSSCTAPRADPLRRTADAPQ